MKRLLLGLLILAAIAFAVWQLSSPEPSLLGPPPSTGEPPVGPGVPDPDHLDRSEPSTSEPTP